MEKLGVRHGVDVRRRVGWRVLGVASLVPLAMLLRMLPVLVVIAPGRPALAAETATAAAEARAPLRGADQEVLMEIHHANQNEIAAGRLAEGRAAAAGVRELGAALVRDHGAADEQLRALARRKGMDPDKLRHPYDALPHGTLALAKLEALHGAAFDRELTTRTVTDEQRLIDQIAAARGFVQDADVRAFLDGIEPALHRHESTAVALAPKSGGNLTEAASIPAGDRPGMGDTAPSLSPPEPTAPPPKLVPPPPPQLVPPPQPSPPPAR